MNRKFFIPLIPFLFFFISGQAQQDQGPPFLQYIGSKWTDSVLNKLSLEEKIGQLIMVAAYSNRDKEHKQELLKLIREQKIGGLIFFQGDPIKQVKLMNAYHEASEVPLLGAIDAEWGLGMRLDTTISFPFQMALGAVQDEELLYQMGKEIARQIRMVGLHANFAPVVDVNNNPENPVINYRSFGENKFNVARKSIAYMEGMQDQNILTTAKHFPGHGDTSTDSHYALPQINHSIERLDSLELYPFREIIKAGVGGVMVAHLNIPALDSTGIPSTLSYPIVTELLKEKMGFEGLVVTDAMNMKGVTEGNPPGVVDKDAILAGNDLLEFTEDVPKAIAEIKNAIRDGLISEEELDRRVRKVLAVKQWVGLDHYKKTKTRNLIKKLNSPAAKLLQQQLVEASLTVLRNEGNLLPLLDLKDRKIASVSIGSEDVTAFQEALDLYTRVNHFQVPSDAGEQKLAEVKDSLEGFDLVILGIHDHSKFPRNQLIFSEAVTELISDLSEKDNTIVSFFKNPYSMNKIEDIEEAPALLLTYQDSELTEQVAAQLIFGGIGATGKLPVSVGEKFQEGDGIDIEGDFRLSYGVPEAVGMNSDILNRGIDSLMREALAVKATPGGVILVAKDQKVIFWKAYGEHVYHDTIQVEKTDLYDLASVTKISATMPALMKLYDEDKFHLNQTLADHLPKFRGSNKADIPYSDILTHQARFQPWIPFWKNMLRRNGSYKWWTVKKDSSARYPIRISGNMFLHRNYPEKIRKAIRKSPLLEEKKYVYSDFFFILAPEVISNITGREFSQFLDATFYEPLGATSLTFNPLEKFPADDIVPTENDFNFRHEPIDNTVHDEGAIMLGGISGHAGLFGNANDLAKLLQMYLNGGEYGGKRYIEEETLEKFTKTYFPESENRRALGFDKRRPNSAGVVNNTAPEASQASYGHTGFTGIMVWMDPRYDLLYIFLSNRVHPSRENHRLYELDTRTKIHQVLYDSISEKER